MVTHDRRGLIRMAIVAIAWLAYAIVFLLAAPHIGTGAASFATAPAILGGFLLGARGGLAMGVVSLVANELLLATVGRPFAFTPTDLYYASLSAMIGGGVGAVQNIRERARDAARRAEANEERYQLVTRATNDMIWDWDLRTNGIWRNEQYERFLGRAEREAAGELGSWRERIHPDDAERVRASVYAAIEAPAIHQWTGEYRMRRSDGAYALVTDRGYITRDATGTATRMLGSIQDVTMQRASERALRESESAFRTLFENVPIGLYRTTPDGNILLANPALLQMLGYASVEELRGRDLNAGIEAEHSRETYKRLVEGRGVVKDLVSTWTTRDGRKLQVREDARLVVDEQGAPLYYEGSVEDLTPRLRLEAEAAERQAALVRSERLSALGTLVAGVAHEVNNPLAYIRGNVELVQMDLDDLAALDLPDKMREQVKASREQLDVSLRGIDQIATIVSSLKLVARNSAGTRSRENVDALVRNVLRVAQARFPASATVKTELAATRPVHVVTDQITQVLLNLLFNSADAVRQRPDAQIVVRTYDRGAETIIEVSDNGGGIPLAEQSKIFVPFHTTKQEGTGLGLSVSHGIVESHGGRMTFESAPGTGTTFRVALPA